MTSELWLRATREAICSYVAEQEIPTEPFELYWPFGKAFEFWVRDAKTVADTPVGYDLCMVGEEMAPNGTPLAWVRIIVLALARGALLEPDSQVSDQCGNFLAWKVLAMVKHFGESGWEGFSKTDLIAVTKSLLIVAGVFADYERDDEEPLGFDVDRRLIHAAGLAAIALSNRLGAR